MHLEEIQMHLDQPRGYLIKILESICEKKKERNKQVFYLKDVYNLKEAKNEDEY